MAAVRGMYGPAAVCAAMDTMAVSYYRPFVGDLYRAAGTVVYPAGRVDIPSAGPPENKNDHCRKRNSRPRHGRIPGE